MPAACQTDTHFFTRFAASPTSLKMTLGAADNAVKRQQSEDSVEYSRRNVYKAGAEECPMATVSRTDDKLTYDRVQVPRLENGDRLTRAEFERRYAAMPDNLKAELIEGVVYVSSPVRWREHGAQHAAMIRISCPRCKQVMVCKDREAGNKLHCPKCGQRLQLPIPPKAKTVLAKLETKDTTLAKNALGQSVLP
jgi:ribosomal protein S27E